MSVIFRTNKSIKLRFLIVRDLITEYVTYVQYTEKFVSMGIFTKLRFLY